MAVQAATAVVPADIAAALVEATVVLAGIAAAAVDSAVVVAASTAAAADSAAAVEVDSTAAVAAADTTNRTSSARQNFNSSLLHAGCCCFVGSVRWGGAREAKRPQPSKDRTREKPWTLTLHLSNAV